MFKFFRKYNKWILAVGGSVLMVIFLLPQVPGMFQPSPSSYVVGTLGDREITVADQNSAQAEIEVLNRLGINVGIRGDRAGLIWLMMVHEARSQGLYASRMASDAILQQRFDGDARQIDAALTQLRRDLRVPDRFIYQALRHYQMVGDLSQLLIGVRRVSMPQMRHFARDLEAAVTISMVQIDADRLKGQIDKPAPQELKAQFERYRADVPGNSEPYGFGYRQPDRVKLEYLAIPLDRVRDNLDLTDLEIKAASYYQKHPEEFKVDQEDLDAADAEATDLAAGQIKPYVQVRQAIRRKLIDDLALTEQNEIVKTIAAEIAKHEPAAGGQLYRDLPADYVPITLSRLAQIVQEKHGVLPDVVRLDDKWLTLPADIRQIKGFGESVLPLGTEGRQAAPIVVYIDSARELDPPAQQRLRRFGLQAKMLSLPVINEQTKTRYFFRITAASPSHVPASLDEVRQQVEQDVIRMKAYGKLTESADTWVEQARVHGLKVVARDVGVADEPVQAGPFSRLERNILYEYYLGQVRLEVPSLPVVGQNGQFVREVFDLADRVRQAGGLETAPRAERFAAIPVDKLLSVFIVQVEDIDLPTVVDFREFNLDPNKVRLIHRLDMQQLAADPFSFEALKRRTGFVEQRMEEPAEPSDQAPAAPQDAEASAAGA